MKWAPFAYKSFFYDRNKIFDLNYICQEFIAIDMSTDFRLNWAYYMYFNFILFLVIIY